MAKRPTKKQRRDIYQEITDRILQLLDQGTVPWHNPICRGSGDGWPKNLDTQKRYRGINVFLLAITAWEKGFGSDYWLTFRQAGKQGGKIRKGEKSSLVTFWKLFETKDKKTGEDVTLPVLRHYNVFNVEQCEGIEAPDAPEENSELTFTPLEQAETIICNYPNAPAIQHEGYQARYRLSSDTILIPEPKRFEDAESYYGTLFHEAAHNTGISKRLDRGLDDESPAPFGSPDYSKEELVAEMGAAFLNATAGISPPHHRAIGRLHRQLEKNLKGDKRLVVTAAGAAQKAADWILGSEFSTANENGEEPSAPPPENPVPQTSNSKSSAVEISRDIV